MNVSFTPQGWLDLRHWFKEDRTIAERVLALLDDVARDPSRGLGKPEPLRHELSGWWSRRITAEDRLVYRVIGKPGLDQRIEVASCRYHYAS